MDTILHAHAEVLVRADAFSVLDRAAQLRGEVRHIHKTASLLSVRSGEVNRVRASIELYIHHNLAVL